MSTELPFVSICTPTFNRRPFIQTMFQCFLNQTYPKNKMEWIIVDDGSDKVEDLIKASNIEQIKYFPLANKMKLGAKRNFMHGKTSGSILVYMDDDDYYPPERIQHAVETLLKNPTALCAGSSELYIYFKHIKKMYQSGPFGPTHATAGTFAFRRDLLNFTKYNEDACLAEEREFLKNYTIPFVQLDPMKTILVFSHNHNTFDKKHMLRGEHPQYLKESTKKVKDFIRYKKERPIFEFFMKRIDEILETYLPGLPENKPDVLKQMAEIEQERQSMDSTKTGMQIMVETPGVGKRPMTGEEIIHTLSGQQELIKKQIDRIKELEDCLIQLKTCINNKL